MGVRRGRRRRAGDPELLERVVDEVRRHAPQAAIAFNATPADTYEAAARRLATRDR